MKTSYAKRILTYLTILIMTAGLLGMPFAPVRVLAATSPELRAADLLSTTTRRASVTSSGIQGNNQSVFAAISGDGRYVVFESIAVNLASGDADSTSDIFVHDMQTGVTSLVSVASDDVTKGNSGSHNPVISANGQYVAFDSAASNLVSGDSDGYTDVFVRDLVAGTTTRVSVNSGETQGNSWSTNPSISDDGRFVAFESAATNLVSGDSNGQVDVFVRDVLLTTTARASVSTSSVQGNDWSIFPKISGNGRYVTFQSLASTLVSGDNNGKNDIFVRDMQANSTRLVSVTSTGVLSNGSSNFSSISTNGRFVTFGSSATNLLVSGDTNEKNDIFLRDRDTDADGTFDEIGATSTTLISVSSSGAQGQDYSSLPSISSDGRYVTFYSDAGNLVTGDTNGTSDIFLRDRDSNTTIRLSVDSIGAQAIGGGSIYPAISSDGAFVAFESTATNLVSNDTNAAADIFVVPAAEEQVGYSRLDVSKAGTGSGSISSAPAGIVCGTTCLHWYADTDTVVLSAAVDVGSTFLGWSGETCSGTGTCTVTMDASRTVTAAFSLNSHTLEINKTGPGTVTSDPAGINCGATCSAAFDYGTGVLLTAIPSSGAVFIGWSGGVCSGTDPCTVTIYGDKSVTATFGYRAVLPLIMRY